MKEKGFEHVHARNQWGSVALHVAIMEGRMDVVKELLDRGADVNAKDEWGGGTPLFYGSEQKS